ncbi:MAG: hypothetical protein M1816_005834, partial [Peltula sp. TS41687]
MGIAASSATHHQAGRLSPRYITEQGGSPWADQPPASTNRTRRERSPAPTERTGRPRSRSHSPNETSRTGTSLERLNQAHRRRSQQVQVQELRDRHAGRLRDLERAATARIAQETEAREQVTTERDAECRRHEQEIAQLRADNARREQEVRQAREDLAREQADRANELAQIQYQAAAPTTTPTPKPEQPPAPPGPTVQPMEDGPGFRLPNPEPFTGDVGKAKAFLLQLQSKINGEPKLRNDHGLQISYASLLLRDSAAEWALG